MSPPSSLLGLSIVSTLVLGLTVPSPARSGSRAELELQTPSEAHAPLPMNLVITPENAGLCGFDYAHAAAWIQIDEKEDGTTIVLLHVRHVVPDHLYTVWLKLQDPSPLTGGPATPAAAMSDYQEIIDLADTDSADGANAFRTNAVGNATVRIVLDYHLSDGIVPFSAFDPTLEDGMVGFDPFTFLIDSHCTDGLQHGLGPGPNQPTFDVSLM